MTWKWTDFVSSYRLIFVFYRQVGGGEDHRSSHMKCTFNILVGRSKFITVFKKFGSKQLYCLEMMGGGVFITWRFVN